MVVSEDGAGAGHMGEMQPTPEMLFALAFSSAGYRLPRIGEDPTQDGSSVAEQLGVRVDAATAFAIGTGEQVLSKFDEVVRQLTERTSPDLTDYLEWQVHQGELRRVLEQFFGPVAGHPAVIWTHSTCWSDRCFALANGGEVHQKPLAPYKPVSGHRVKLGFECVRSRDKGPAGSKNYVVVEPWGLQWLLPPGMAGGRFLRSHGRFVRYHEDSHVIRHGQPMSFIHRERLGAGAPSVEHKGHLDKGLFPALDGKTYGLWREPDTGIARVTPVDILSKSPNSPLSPIKIIDESGIRDVHIFKVHRYFDRAGPSGRREFLFDELTVNFERNTSRVVWIGTQRDLFCLTDPDWFARTGQGRLIARLSNP